MKQSCLLVLAILLVLPARTGWGQAAIPELQVYGSYSLLRPKLPVRIGDRSVRELGEFSLGNVLGWDSGATLRVWRSLGITAGISGYYRSLDTQIQGIGVRGNMSAHTFLFGPAYTIQKGTVRPFAHVLVGVGHLHADGTVDTINSAGTSTAFAGALGGGVDIAINRRLAVRAIQFDYFPVRNSHQGGLTFHNMRWGTGIVLALY